MSYVLFYSTITNLYFFIVVGSSERVEKSGIGGQIFSEACHINLSLHYLEQVIVALSESNRTHVPYRNSMMTSALRDSLGGNCLTVMIALLAVEQDNIEVSEKL